jgi:hypothetical protein
MIPTDPKARLRRKAAAEALTQAGFPITAATLATKASRGGGPPFQLFGRVPLYQWASTLRWAESRLDNPQHSTSESSSASRAGRATRAAKPC